MFLLNHVNPKDAKGKISEAYAIYPPPFPVPEPVLLSSVSPELSYIQSQGIRYFMAHPKLDYGLMAMIRYIIACDIDFTFDIKMNSDILKQAGGMSEKDLENLRNNPEDARLEAFQKAMLLFVLKAIRTPKEVTQEDIDDLREHGWEDRDIYDAVNNAAGMLASDIIFKAFRK